MLLKRVLALVGLFVLVAMCIGGGILLYIVRNAPPFFSMEQVPSAHSGYLCTTLTSGNTVYVHDYEEYPLLVDSDTRQVIGQLGIGNTEIYAIPGQTTYVALMDPMWQEVHRDINQPLFDWRTAKFQKMRLAILLGPAANKETADPQIIQDVLTTLKEGSPITVSLQPVGNYGGYNNYGVCCSATNCRDWHILSACISTRQAKFI